MIALMKIILKKANNISRSFFESCFQILFRLSQHWESEDRANLLPLLLFAADRGLGDIRHAPPLLTNLSHQRFYYGQLKFMAQMLRKRPEEFKESRCLNMNHIILLSQHLTLSFYNEK